MQTDGISNLVALLDKTNVNSDKNREWLKANVRCEGMCRTHSVGSRERVNTLSLSIENNTAAHSVKKLPGSSATGEMRLGSAGVSQ